MNRILVGALIVAGGLAVCGRVPAREVVFRPIPLDGSLTNGQLISLGGTGVYTNTYPDTFGHIPFLLLTTNLNGAGVPVGQVEAPVTNGPLPSYFEANPGIVGWTTNHFAFFCNGQWATTFTNAVGGESGHAENVANDFYGRWFGVATNVSHVNLYDAASFNNSFINSGLAVTDRVVNQSYTFTSYNSGADQNFDNSAYNYNVLYVTAAGLTGGSVNTPATCYNGIAVGVYNAANSPTGPTVDGRCKPDLTAWANQAPATSYSAPVVAGAAAVLIQAALRGDGGANTNAATDIRTIKALLLNGAVKPPGWSNNSLHPLDYTYGAGIVNLLNSYEQLAGGQHAYSSSATGDPGTPFPPSLPLPGITQTADSSGLLRGWDFNVITNDYTADGFNDYYFALTNSPAGGSTFTATLVWNRMPNWWYPNVLWLNLYNADTGVLVTNSVSYIDNVQHVYIPSLPAGNYDLQVCKSSVYMDTLADTYALAYESFAVAAQTVASGTNMVLSWPLYPSGFSLQGTTNLTSPNWVNVTNPTPVIVQGQYQLTIPDFNPAALSYVTVTNIGATGNPSPGGGGGPVVTNIITVPIYNENMDLHYFRLVRPNF